MIESNILLSNVKVRMDETEAIKTFSSDDVTKIAGGRARKNIAELQKSRANENNE